MNVAMLQSLTDIQLGLHHRRGATNPEGSKSGARRRKRSSSISYDSEEPTRASSSSSHRNKRKRRYRNNSRDELKKVKPPTFDGELKNNKKPKLGFLG